MKRFLAFLLCLVSLCGSISFATEGQPQKLHAKSVVLMDAESGRVLFEKDGQTVMPMASTTKIMTCILALENGGMDDIVVASENAVKQPKVHLGMKENEKYYLKDLLYSLMLESHNDSAVAIAEHLAGTIEQFAEMMNEKAKEIGCKNTYFITPNGLDGKDEKGSHATTAEDLANIMRYCITESPNKEEFLEITQMANYTFSDLDKKRTFTCSNKNSLLYMYDGVISGKTGFTGSAGYCYVGAAKRDGRTFVVALLACGWPNNKTYKWKDSQKLFDYAFEQYDFKEEVVEDLPEIKVLNGIPKGKNMFSNTFLEVEKEKEMSQILCREDEEIQVEINLPNEITAPIKKGEVLGEIKYSIGNIVIDRINVKAKESVKEKTFTWYCKRLFEKYFT